MSSSLCSCEEFDHSCFGRIIETEKLVRILTDRQFKPSGKLETTCFSLKDIREVGVSLVRTKYIGVKEFQEIGEVIKLESGAKEIRGALLANVADIRNMTAEDGTRQMCVKDDPIKGEQTPDNEAHAIILSTKRIDELEAKDIRDTLLSVFESARYLGDVWAA